MSQVGDLLAQSRAAHATYRRYAGSTDRKGNITQAYDAVQCEPAVKLALETRLEAHKLDPEHTDPAWQQDDASHEKLVTFYEKFLGLAFAPIT